MKKLLSLFLSLCIVLLLCSCEAVNFGELYSAFQESFEEGIYITEETVEIRYEEYEVRDPQFKACYTALNSKQKELYSRIYAISEQMPEGFVSLGENYSGGVTDIAIAYKAFLNDNAEVFWMPKSYILGTSSNKSKQHLAIAFEYHGEENQNSYTVSKEKRDTLKASMDNVSERVVRAAGKLNTEYEKEKYINDFLCDIVTYTENGDFVHTAYGALVNGAALCEGYSRAFKLLCNKLGIECDLIVGEAEGVGHMWNRVNIDKKLSYVDVTWNDRSEFRTYTYFNITEEQLLADHTIAPLFSELKDGDVRNTLFNFTKKSCGYTGNTFYEKNNRILWQDYYNTASAEIGKAAAEGEKYAEFMFATENIKSLFTADPEKFITQIQNKLINVIITGYSTERDTVIFFFE